MRVVVWYPGVLLGFAADISQTEEKPCSAGRIVEDPSQRRVKLARTAADKVDGPVPLILLHG